MQADFTPEQLREVKEQFRQEFADKLHKPVRRLLYWMRKHRLKSMLDVRCYLAAVHNTTTAEVGETLDSIAEVLRADWEKIEAARRNRQGSVPRRPCRPHIGPQAATGAIKQKRGTINQRLLERLTADPESAYWSQREWAHFLGCSPAGVAKAPGWEKVKAIRRLAIVDRLDRRQK